MQLILASASIGREFLLKGLKIPYKVIPSNIDEDKIVEKNLLETIKLRAKLKGESVANKINQQLTISNQQFLILSADTEVILGNQLLGKPKDYKNAVRMLRMLSGKTHEVVTAVYILLLSLKSPKRLIYSGFDRSLVTFHKLTDKDINLYLSLTDYTRFTGSYALVASPQNFITKIEGSISNVIGLPLEKVIPIFRINGIL